MNKNIGKGIGNPTNKYRTGDVIWHKTTLGSPGVGWMSAGSSTSRLTNIGLYKAFYNEYDLTPLTWVSRSINQLAFIQEIAYGNGLWVAAGNQGQILTSTDTVAWVSRTSGFSTNEAWSLAYGNGFWVAGDNFGNIRASTDAITWVPRVSTILSNVYDIAYANGIFVACGVGGVRTSTDTITWVTREAFVSDTLQSVAYGNGVWVVAGNSAQLRTSTDAITWTTRVPNITFSSVIYSVAYGNGLWVFTGNLGIVRSSTDAITWVTRSLNASTFLFDSVAFGDGIWAAVNSSGGLLRTSTDGITWVTRPSFASAEPYNIVFANSLWVVSGNRSIKVANQYDFPVPNTVPAPPGYTTWFKT